MQVKVAARHGHLSEAHQAELREKAEKLLHFFDRLTFIEVTADLHEKWVEVVAKCEHKHDFVSKVEDPDLLAAMGAAVDKIKQQIKHYKERLQDHRHNPSASGNGHRP